MPQPNKIPLAFAASGDKNAIPESTETTGLASWREGFPAITSAPFSEGGIAPKRADFNGIFYALSQAVMWLQQGGVYAYDVNTDYEAGNVVLDAGGLYVANAANGPSSAVVQPSSDTTGATWKLVRLDLATPTAAGYMSAADKTALDDVLNIINVVTSGTALRTSAVSSDSYFEWWRRSNLVFVHFALKLNSDLPLFGYAKVATGLPSPMSPISGYSWGFVITDMSSTTDSYFLIESDGSMKLGARGSSLPASLTIYGSLLYLAEA